VTYTGFRNDDFRPFVYKTTDYGQTWTSIAGDLPEGPVNVVREDVRNSNLLFAGTDFGVYVSIDAGKHWTKMKNNMPTQPVHDLKIQPRESDLIVASHGRGIFILDISSLEDLSPELLAADAHLFPIKSKIRWEGFDRSNSSSSNFNGQSEPTGLVINYFLKAKPKGDVKVQVFNGNLLINELNGPSNPGLNTVVWPMTGRRERTPEEKKALQERLQRAREMGYMGRMGGADINYASFPVSDGDYRFVLVVDGKSFTGSASILKDYWYR
jgi:hypothetical protein